MTKQELLDDLAAKSIVVVNTDWERDSIAEAAGINRYYSTVLIQNRKQVTLKGVGWYVVNEGTQDEAAYYRDSDEGAQVRGLVSSYLDTLVPSTYLRIKLGTVDEDNKFAFAEAYELQQDDTVLKKDLFIYNVGQSIVHKEMG